ncbi:MAG: hypothetical protein JXM70_00735 [Pirellulales bacterium]|nr:hypothetical protein [Pirellulales bacterium]
MSAENLAAGAIAGCLAQAKCCAEREYGQDVCFDKDVYSKDLVHILRDEDRSSPDVVPGRCELGFLAKNRPVTSCLEGAWFSGMDAGQYRMARRALFPMDSTDRQLVRSVLVELDEARNWRAICRIADALCSQPPSDDGRLILEGTTVVRMIQESDAENEQKTTDE